MIAEEKDTNDEIFWNYFKYQNPSILAKDLIRATQAKNQQLVNNVNDGLIDLRTAINSKKSLKMKIQIKLLKQLKKFSTLTNNKKVQELKY